jgi:hypothetical protein
VTAEDHNKVVDDAWQNPGSDNGRLRAAAQVLDLYGGRAWRGTITRAVYVMCLTAIVVTLLWRLL